MKFTTTLAVASLFSAVFVAATPLRYEDEFEVAGRDFDDYEVAVRDFDDYEVDARYFEDYDEFDAREFEDALMLYLRSGLGKAFIKAGKDTADIAAQKAYDLANSPGPRVNRPGIAANVQKPAAKPKPAGGVRPKIPISPIKAPAKSGTNWKAAWDASKGKK